MSLRVQLLASHCTDPTHLQPLTTFLVNDQLAIDAGSLGIALPLDQQRLIRHVVITHAHSDHTGALPIFMAEVFPFLDSPVVIHAIEHAIESIQRHIFNDAIWPDFHQIALTNGAGPSLIYRTITPGVPFEIHGLRITPVAMNHTVPCVGLVVEDGASAVIFTSDTYHTDEIWQVANRLDNLRAIFVDVSYPNEQEQLAAVSKHLTPQSLDAELAKLTRPTDVYAVHLKPQFRRQVIEQLAQLNRPRVFVAEINHQYSW